MSYGRRAKAERCIARKPPPRLNAILSTNKKTGTSLNLPVKNCRPTKRCAAACYACQGPISWKNSIKKALAVDEILRSGEIEGLIWECRRLQDVRLNGSGDMTLDHVPGLLRLTEACPDTVFWGFTRKREIAEALNGKQQNLSLILSFDATSPDTDIAGYDGPLAFGPNRSEDQVPHDPRIIVVFPEHHSGRTMKGVPAHLKDCPATRGD